jgi:hypothetical protein
MGTCRALFAICTAFIGIKVTFDPSVTVWPPINLDMKNVTFSGATRALETAAGRLCCSCAANLRVRRERHTGESRCTDAVGRGDGLSSGPNQRRDARTGERGSQHLRHQGGDLRVPPEDSCCCAENEQVLREVNAVYDDMLDGNPEVLFDVSLYELDKTLDNNVGATLPKLCRRLQHRG